MNLKELIWAAFVLPMEIAMIFFVGYQTIISIIGMFTKNRKARAPLDHKRFAVLVCAHNEEAVVGQIVQNLLSLDYPSNKYDVYVICDNCTDRTADIVRSHGGITMERHDPYRRGKGYGLEWMFANLWEMERKGISYDAVVIFDADNLASKNFLQVMNQKLWEGYEVAQGYLDSKNPHDNWITKSYAYAYWCTNRIFQLSREKIGLSAQLGGTGFMVTTSLLKEMGWGSTSLTEDLEFTTRYVMNTGKRVAWAHEAKTYDEKPLDMKSSYKQRVRWMQGHMDCMVRYFVPLMKKMFVKEGWMRRFDVMVYLVQPTRAFTTLTSFGFLLLSMTDVLPPEYSKYVFGTATWVATITGYYMVPIIGLFLEKKGKYLLWSVPAYLYALSWIPIVIEGFLKRKERVWTHTKHARTLNQEELRQVGM